jgi:hypothetical protein
MNRITAACLAVALVTPALGHSWYPLACCSSADCWPMGVDDDAQEPIPRFEAGYWILHDGTRIADANTRDSPDGRFHTCRHGGNKAAGIIIEYNGPACLWVPRGAS